MFRIPLACYLRFLFFFCVCLFLFLFLFDVILVEDTRCGPLAGAAVVGAMAGVGFAAETRTPLAGAELAAHKMDGTAHLREVTGRVRVPFRDGGVLQHEVDELLVRGVAFVPLVEREVVVFLTSGFAVDVEVEADALDEG